MSIRLLVSFLVCAVLVGCATGKRAGPPVAASEVQVYNSTQLVPSQYTVVQHIWIDSSRSAFGYPSFRNAEDGIQAMREQAGKAGATGVIHVLCLDGKGWVGGKLLCYGDAVKFN